MKVCLRKTAATLSLLMLFLLTASGGTVSSTKLRAHGATAPNDPAIVLRVKLLLEKDSPVLEITFTRPIRPLITRIQDPPSLRIDLNNAKISVHHKEIAVQSPLIGVMHLDQFSQDPSVVRIVVTELKPLSYTWDAAGNRLSIRLHRESEEVKSRPPSVPALTRDTETVAVPVSTAGNIGFLDRMAPGASFSARFDTETLRLARGGEVHVCPGTTLSIVHAQNEDLTLAMGVGAFETHYALEDSADTIVTPDFRILLRGPGEFHYAIRADSQGNTCVRALPNNTAPVVVYESIGNGQFEVLPSEKLVFHAGHLSTTDTAFHSEHLAQVETVVPEDCGCPPRVPVLRAEVPATPVPAENDISSVSLAPQSTVEAAPTQVPMPQNASTATETAPLPPLGHDEKPVEFEARLLFSPKDAPPPRLVNLPLSSRQIPFPNANVAPPALPQVTNKKAHKGVFGKLTGFFSRIFR